MVEEIIGGRREGARWQADRDQLPPGVRRGAGGGLWPASSSADRRRDTTQPHASRLLQPSAHPSDCSDPNALTTQLQHVPGATTTEIEILCARSTVSSGHTKIRFPTPSRRARAGARRRCEADRGGLGGARGAGDAGWGVGGRGCGAGWRAGGGKRGPRGVREGERAGRGGEGGRRDQNRQSLHALAGRGEGGGGTSHCKYLYRALQRISGWEGRQSHPSTVL